MYIALVFIVMIISGTFIIVNVRKGEESLAEGDLKKDVEIIIGNIRDASSLESIPFGFEEVPSSGHEWNILDWQTGKTLLTSVTKDELSYPTYGSSVIIAAKDESEEGHFLSGRQYPNIRGQFITWMEYAQAVKIEETDETPEYIIYVRMDAERINRGIGQTTQTIAFAIFLAMVLAGLIGVLFASTLTEPIRMLTAKAKELARGNLKQEIEVASKDEIGQLTESFNNMARELSKTIEGMENEKNKMEIVLYNMTDGVLAYDNNGDLIHANQVSQELLNIQNIESITIAEMFKILLPETENFDLEKVDNFKEFTLVIGDKFINASLSPYRNKEGSVEGIVIVFQDITKHKKLDNMRKEFVANVSHEIRTPLTNIKSYTETLIDGALDQRGIAMEFLEIINGEADRMTLIVKDLLELSSLDNNQIVLNVQEINLNELIRQTVKKHILTAEKQNKVLIFEDYGSPMPVKVDASRVSQVFGNIISNSIKYSSDGCAIKVFSEESAGYYKIYIQDNGFGIPKEDLRRIFERFYRVDKARSRAMGGTGLGLSIAKEIMQAHGGKISASSELGKGTTMILRFPKSAKSTLIVTQDILG